MILCSAIHHPEAKERDNLLHMLFNLIKRPDEDQRWGVKNLLLLISLSLSLSLVSYNTYATIKVYNDSIPYNTVHCITFLPQKTEYNKMQVSF